MDQVPQHSKQLPPCCHAPGRMLRLQCTSTGGTPGRARSPSQCPAQGRKGPAGVSGWQLWQQRQWQKQPQLRRHQRRQRRGTRHTAAIRTASTQPRHNNAAANPPPASPPPPTTSAATGSEGSTTSLSLERLLPAMGLVGPLEEWASWSALQGTSQMRTYAALRGAVCVCVCVWEGGGGGDW